jgi:hypothetical protein
MSSPHLEASPTTTFRACSSPAPTPIKPQLALVILSQESVHTLLPITHHTRKRPSAGPQTTQVLTLDDRVASSEAVPNRATNSFALEAICPLPENALSRVVPPGGSSPLCGIPGGQQTDAGGAGGRRTGGGGVGEAMQWRFEKGEVEGWRHRGGCGGRGRRLAPLRPLVASSSRVVSMATSTGQRRPQRARSVTCVVEEAAAGEEGVAWGARH